MQPNKVRVSKRRDVRIHAHLWHTSKCLLDRAKEEEKGSFHQFMASLVFTAFTLEAYLNWLGQKIVPHWKYLERLNPKEKLEVISGQLGVAVDFGARPWQIVRVLFGFRNDIAHGKPEELTVEAFEPLDEFLDGKLGSFVLTDWEKFCTLENAEKARNEVEQILETLHKSAGLKGDPGPFFGGFQVHGASL